jgi:uncharacterized protein (DUF305 family)
MPAFSMPSRRHAVLVVSAFGLAVTLAACGGGTTSSGHAGMSSAGSAAAGTSAAPSSASASGMAGMHSYPPITPGPAASGAHNDTDVAFADDMIPHHGQAVQMADMILAKTSNPDVKALAERIKAAQMPEIVTMAGWLKGWGQAVPDPYAHAAGMAGMQHGGMMSDEQLDQLDKATGVEADKVFLTQMQEHHAGAVGMATTELAKGSNPETKKLAQAISTSQTAEIAEMKAMLAKLG